MKKYYWNCLLILLIFGRAIAQDDKLNIESIKAPTMPSASIIGIQPNDINSPKSLKALEAAILSNYVDENQSLVVPNNYALEFNPFMISGKKNFNYLDYLANDVGRNIIQNLSFSVSSTTKYIINDSISSNAMGFGIRTILLNGKPTEDLVASFNKALAINQINLDFKSKVISLLDNLPEKDTSKLQIMNFLISEICKNIKDKYPDPCSSFEYKIIFLFSKIDKFNDLNDLEDQIEDLSDEYFTDASLNELSLLLQKVKIDRYGWRVELDYAQALSFPTSSFDYSISPRWGLWTNVSYRPATLKDGNKTPWNFEFIGLARIINNNDDFINKYTPTDTTFKTGTIFDLGAKIAYDYKKFTVDIEYIHRFNRNKIIKTIDGEEYSRTENFDTHKYLLSINYNISDNIALSYNIGQGFESAFNDGGNLISGLSLNFGFGNIKAEDLIKEKPE